MVTQRAREALNDQRNTARRALLHYKEKFSLLLINTKLRGNILSVLWQVTLRRTLVMRRFKLDSSNMKQMRDFTKTRRSVISTCHEANEAHEDS